MSILRLVPASGPPIEIRKDVSLVGRDPGCDVVVPDGSVSRKHARLERRGEIWYAVDQASANGTFLDSVRVGESPLLPGQELRFGAVSYRVEIEGGPPPDLAVTLAPEAGATVIQPMPAAPKSPSAPPAPPPPPPPPPPPVTAEVPIPARVAPPAAAGVATPPRAAGAPPLSMPPQATRQGRTPAFWMVTGGCGCLLLLVLAIVGVVVLPCGGAFTALWKATEAPVAEIRAQLQEIKAGDLDAAYARFSQSYRASVSRADFEALVAAHPALKDNAESTFNQRNVSGDTATMSGSLKSSSGAVEAVTYQLVKEGGAWKISSLRFAGDASVPPLGSPEEGTAAANGPTVQNAGLKKNRAPGGVEVVIHLNITGVGTRSAGTGLEWDIAVDLELLDPNGRAIFSQSPFKQLSEPTQNRAETVTFQAKLTLPDHLGAGNYVARFVVHDRVTGGRREHDVSFTLP